jgi:hypothetical protein
MNACRPSADTIFTAPSLTYKEQEALGELFREEALVPQTSLRAVLCGPARLAPMFQATYFGAGSPQIAGSFGVVFLSWSPGVFSTL